ncbi:MAG: L-threonylcarbamoyladenylate synthase [Methylovirgula sp.]
MLGADPAALAMAVDILRAGGLVAFPTETVFGLGADATSDAAVAKIYAAKGRPAFNPLIAHVATRAAAEQQGVFSPQAIKLADAFWPGPLTLVLPLAEGSSVCDLARAGLGSVALRVPSHPVAQRLLAVLGQPLAAPSANPSGRVSAVTAAHVREDFDGKIDAIIEGSVNVGVESTIVACLADDPVMLRPGGIPRGEIEAVLGVKLRDAVPGAAINAPGMVAAHYAPRARLRLDAESLEPDEAGLDFGGRFAPGSKVLDLSPRGDLTEAAAHLFAYLRRLDERHPKIAVARIPSEGLGEAINDRLRRAAVGAR